MSKDFVYTQLHIKKKPGSLSWWVECSPIVRETGVQFQVESYQRLLKWYLILPCLTLSNLRYVSSVKRNNPEKRVVPSPTPRCSSDWKVSLLIAPTTVANFTYLLHVKTVPCQTIQFSVYIFSMWKKQFYLK